MSLESSISSLPHVYRTSVEQKAASRDAAKLYKYGSPKLRDLLRDKCRLRMKEARQSNFELSRRFRGSGPGKFEILREEISELEQDIELQEAIYKELLDEVNDWFIEEQIEEDSYLVSTEVNDDILCPICQKQFLQCSLLNAGAQRYQCKCGIGFDYLGNVEMLRCALRLQIDAHEQNCRETLVFFIEPKPMSIEINQLNVICDKCDYFNSF